VKTEKKKEGGKKGRPLWLRCNGLGILSFGRASNTFVTTSDTPLIDHLVMREFVSGSPSYRSIHKRVRDREPSFKRVREQFADLKQSSLRNDIFEPETCLAEFRE